MRKTFGYISGLLGFLILLMVDPFEGLNLAGQRTLAVTLLMAAFWMTEAIHLAATALLPLALFPLLSILPMKETAARYADPNIYLFLGGFLMAMSMQKWQLHQRIAYQLLSRIGTKLSHLILGFMATSALFSMWISNTATAVMLLPIGLAVVALLEKESELEEAERISWVIMLAIAYSASIGGTATLIGTPPNIILAGQLHSLTPDQPQLSFLQWMLFGIPTALGFWLITAVYLLSKARGGSIRISQTDLSVRLKSLGPLSREEVGVMIIFSCAVIGWLTRQDIDLGFASFQGWQSRLGLTKIHDGTVAMAAALSLFLIPSSFAEKRFLLDWEEARKLPWEVLLLFGGGFALSESFHKSGLSQWIGNHLSILQGLPEVLIILGIALTVSFLTELTSNTATAATLLPILAALAQTLGVPPPLLMIPAAVSASYAFMLPVATPPNAILFGSGKVPLQKMIRTGVVLNLLGAVWITLMMTLLGRRLFT